MTLYTIWKFHAPIGSLLSFNSLSWLCYANNREMQSETKKKARERDFRMVLNEVFA